MKSHLLIIFSILLFTFSCKKKEQEELGTSPIIELISVTPTEIKEFEDSIIVMLSYEDRDGDLGSENPDENFLEIRDTRLEKPDFYFVQPLSPPGTAIHIKGTLRVYIKNIFLLGNGDTEYTTLEIRMRDRAGNWSNLVTSEQLKITR
jgi:hypothetical protein